MTSNTNFRAVQSRLIYPRLKWPSPDYTMGLLWLPLHTLKARLYPHHIRSDEWSMTKNIFEQFLLWIWHKNIQTNKKLTMAKIYTGNNTEMIMIVLEIERMFCCWPKLVGWVIQSMESPTLVWMMMSQPKRFPVAMIPANLTRQMHSSLFPPSRYFTSPSGMRHSKLFFWRRDLQKKKAAGVWTTVLLDTLTAKIHHIRQKIN